MLPRRDGASAAAGLVKVLPAVYVSAGTVNRGPGIYNSSLPRRHKALVFINVNARDLHLNVSFMSPWKRCVNEEGRRGGRGGEMGMGRTDGQTDGDVR